VPVSGNGAGRRPRVLLVGRTRYRLPLPEWLAKKFDALDRQLDYRVLASAAPGADTLVDDRFRLVAVARPRALDGLLFYLRLPLLVRRQIVEFRPDAIVAESPYEAAPALLARATVRGARPRVVVEVHGDWRTATRMYGSPRRKALSPVADSISRIALRRGDAVRAVSPYTGGLVEDVRGIPVTAIFPTFTDLGAFTERPVQPLPERPVALFVGVLEHYKNIDGLTAAWRRAAERLPGAKLVLVGKGSRRDLVESLVADLPDQVEWIPELPPAGVAEQLDACTVFALPSRSEGLPRVLLEAFARGRGAIGGRAGGIPELVVDGETGLLVDPEDVDGLVEAFVRALGEPGLAERFGAAAHERYRTLHTTPAEYATRVRGLVDATLRDAGELPAGRRRVLLVGTRSYRSPQEAAADATLGALREEVDYCVLARASRDGRPKPSAVGPGSIHLVRRWPGPLDSFLFHLTLPFRVARLVRRFRPEVVIAENPYLGFLVLEALVFRRRSRPALVIEAHGDWRLATRVGGSRLRVLAAPVADWAARYALRRADALRALSPFTARLAEREAGVPPLDYFPAYIDLTAFAGPPAPLPPAPSALFVGALERSKNVGALTEAWPEIAARVPGATLTIVGRGALLDLVERLRDDYPGRVEHFAELPPAGVAERLDASTCLVVPSRSEGLGRVVLESFSRGRCVVATSVGGLADLVTNDVDGLLVPPSDRAALVEAVVRVLSDRGLAERLGAGARESSRRLEFSADEYASRVRTLVDRTLAGAGDDSIAQPRDRIV
jgi:glycosyltransferase involved in cell wall biosynthesis